MHTLRLSTLAPGSVQSEIRAMSVECERVGGINMAQGICDTDVPAAVSRGAQAAMDAGNNIYTRLDGISRLRSAIAADWQRRHGVLLDAEREVMITAGATGAFYATALALLDPGDQVIVFEPFYGYHVSTLRSMRVDPVIVPLELGTWALDLDALRSGITNRTRAIFLNTPSNPCGKVFTRDELLEIGQLAMEHDLFIFADEIYEHFVYGERRHISMASLDGMRERTVTFSGFSKTFSVTGWRVGSVVADARWTPSIGYFHDMVYICAPAPLQHGCAAGLEQLPPSFYAELADEHERKRGRIVNALRHCGLKPHQPDGAYYVLANATSIPGETAAVKARELLRRTGVASVAGSAFFGNGAGSSLLRFCFAKKEADLKEACERLQRLTANC